MRLFGFVRLFFGFVRLFFRNFSNVPKESSFQFFLIFCKRTNVKKVQRVPFFQNFRHYKTVQNSNFFRKFFRLPYFFQKFFNVPKASSFQFFDILQQNECYKILRRPFFTFSALCDLAETSKRSKKIRKFFLNF